MPPLTVHHLQYSQSERIPFLLSELALTGHAIPHTLTIHQRAPFLSPPTLASLHPMHAAPVITDTSPNGEAFVLAESGAIVDYILDVYAPSSPLKIRSGQPGFVEYIHWYHWANANLQACIMRVTTIARAGLAPDHPATKNVNDRLSTALAYLDTHLRSPGVKYLAGPHGGFSAADIMVVFSLTTMRRFTAYSLEGYEGILAYLQRIAGREGYRRAMAEADAGMDWREAMGAEAPRGFAVVMEERKKKEKESKV